MNEPSSPLRVERCTVADLEAHPNFHALISDYADECATEGLPRPRGDLDLYKTIEKAGFAQAVKVTYDDQLIGFAVVISTINPHRGITLSVTETLFISKESRKRGAGLRLIGECRRVARDVGAPKLLLTAHEGSYLLELLTIMKSCTPISRAFAMEVGDE